MRNAQGVFLALGLVAVLVGAWLGWSTTPALDPGGGTEPGHVADDPGRPLTVHVSGWVASPGVVTIPDGSIVADAVVAAGGAKPEAALDRINLSRLIVDGELIEIPGPSASIQVGGTDDSSISVNRADASELESLPGVGPVLAARIVSFRETQGPFQTVEDLLDVTGIGEAKLASIRDLITVP